MSESVARFKIVNQLGLHARAATKLVQLASKYPVRGRGRARRPERERQERHGGPPALRLEGHGDRGARHGRARRGVRRGDRRSSSPTDSGRVDERDVPLLDPAASARRRRVRRRATRACRSGVVLKGIAGSPGRRGRVCARRRRHADGLRATAPLDARRSSAEVERLHRAVEDAKRHLREVSARLPTGPLETNAILDAYLTMVGDPMLHRAGRAGRSATSEVRRVGRRAGERRDRASSSPRPTPTSATRTSPSGGTTSSSCATGSFAS